MKAKDRMYVYNQSSESLVATEVLVADTHWKRLIGLLGKTRQWARPGRGLWIRPSRGVHTIGMMFPIDLIFLDRARQVVHLEEYVRPFCISKVCLKADSVLELPPYTIFRSQTRVGDQLQISQFAPNPAPEPAANLISGGAQSLASDPVPNLTSDLARNLAEQRRLVSNDAGIGSALPRE